MALIPTEAAALALLDRRSGENTARAATAALLDFAARFPTLALGALARRAGQDSFAAQLLGVRVPADPEVAAQVAAELTDDSSAARIRAILERPRLPEADPADLPRVLAAPPWTVKRKRVKATVIKDLHVPQDMHLDWLPGEQEDWLHSSHYLVGQDYDESWQHLLDDCMSGSGWYDAIPMFLLNGPVELLLPVIDSLPQPRNLSYAADYMGVALSRFGDPIVPFVFTAAQDTPTTLAQVLMPVGGARIASFMVTTAARAKSVRPVAAAWFARHPQDAAAGLIPHALEKAGKVRKQAEDSLLRLLRDTAPTDSATTDTQENRRAIILAAADSYGPEARAAIETLLDSDPLEALPTRMPELPDWLAPASLPQLTARAGTSIPLDLIPHVFTIFALSTLDEPYAGLGDLREATDPVSLAAFARGMFELWKLAGYPSKQGWILDAQGLAGDDETVHMLSPLIRAWPGESAHKRAVTGLRVLTAIGTDTALTHLNRIGQKVKFKALRETARDMIDQIADRLGLSTDELADRLVPDFDLGPDGSRVLDYGPRQFTVGFDEALKPFVSQDGQRRKTLPKPGVKDDEELAEPAYEWFKTLKKEVRATAGEQIERLERAMVEQRSWTAELFTTLFLEHPFMVHLARRLVWVTAADPQDAAHTAFRVAEDGTLADAEDDEFVLPEQATVRLAHPLTLDSGTQDQMAELFADYEILQPFEQLGREVYELTAQNKSTGIIEAFAGSTVATTKILAMEKRGWARVAPEDGGIQPAFLRDLPDGSSLYVNLDPGIVVGEPLADGFNEQPWHRQSPPGPPSPGTNRNRARRPWRAWTRCSPRKCCAT